LVTTTSFQMRPIARIVRLKGQSVRPDCATDSGGLSPFRELAAS
jgi:hypothetical protein